MQQAIPYTSWVPPPSASTSATAVANSDDSQPHPSENSPNSVKIGANLQKLVAENPVIVFGRIGCCMCHVVKRLLLGLGVNPAVVEVGQPEEAVVISELSRISGEDLEFPAVFVGGKSFGGLERVMATHISGELVPVLKGAGALWL